MSRYDLDDFLREHDGFTHVSDKGVDTVSGPSDWPVVSSSDGSDILGSYLFGLSEARDKRSVEVPEKVSVKWPKKASKSSTKAKESEDG